MSGRIIALDLGDARMGVAVSDEMGVIAQPYEVYKRVGFGPDARYVEKLCRRFDTKRVLMGLPLNMDGTAGFQAQKAMAFGEILKGAGLEVLYQDERLSTVSAESALIEGGASRQKRRGTVDKIAAAVILRQYLDSRLEQQTPEAR